MVTGVIGLLGEPAVHLVEVELNHDQGFATTQRHQMVEQHALVLAQRANHVMPKAAL